MKSLVTTSVLTIVGSLLSSCDSPRISDTIYTKADVAVSESAKIDDNRSVVATVEKPVVLDNTPVIDHPKLPSLNKGVPMSFGGSGGLHIPRPIENPAPDDWPRWGQNQTNNNHNAESKLSLDDATNFEQRCAIKYRRGLQTPLSGSTSSQPIVVNDVVYWTGFGGYVGASKLLRDRNGVITGCEDLWDEDVSSLLGLSIDTTEPSSRISPAYYVTPEGQGALLYTAVANAFLLPNPFDGISLPIFAFALDAHTGKKLFQIEIAEPGTVNPDDLFAATTSSPVVYDGVAYLGISSTNNAFSPAVPLTFRGQIIAIDLNRREPTVKWRQFMLPERPQGYVGDWFAGAGVWASGGSFLPGVGKNNKGIIFFGTGQLYQYPLFTEQCMLEDVPPQMFGTFTADKRGQTGGGEVECYQRSTEDLALMGITHPIASNSIVALNIEDGSFAWHYPTQGIDAWQLACGADSSGGPGCTVDIAGPDWDVGGSAPVLANIDGEYRLISHNKGGAVFVLDALTGKKIYDIDLCVGSPNGGIHWGLSYDPDTEQILAACSGGSFLPVFGLDVLHRQVLADGTVTCATGFLNGIDVRTGVLKWQSVAAQSPSAPSFMCPATDYVPDLRFKSGLTFDFVYRNTPDGSVAVNFMPQSAATPVTAPGEVRMHTTVTTAGGMIFAPTLNGNLYILKATDGTYLDQLHCDMGGIYQGVAVTSDTVSFGCGYSFLGPQLDGMSVMVFALPSQP